MKDTEYAGIPVGVSTFPIFRRLKHDKWMHVRVDCIIVSAHIICGEIDTHCPMAVQMIVENVDCAAVFMQELFTWISIIILVEKVC